MVARASAEKGVILAHGRVFDLLPQGAELIEAALRDLLELRLTRPNQSRFFGSIFPKNRESNRPRKRGKYQRRWKMANSHQEAPGLWRGLMGIELSPVSHLERLVSALGGCVGILGVYAVSRALLGSTEAPFLTISVGASAVLLFAVPHGPLSQPWPVIGGHLISATIGVACARLLPDPLVATGAALGLAIGSMHYLRCIHPPGGATALAAVLGGEQVQALGFGFVVAPVLVNVLVVLALAVGFNAFFSWRRYPVHLAQRGVQATPASDGYGPISHEDFVYALTQMDSFIDVSEEDLLRIYALATGRHRELQKTENASSP